MKLPSPRRRRLRPLRPRERLLVPSLPRSAPERRAALALLYPGPEGELLVKAMGDDSFLLVKKELLAEIEEARPEARVVFSCASAAGEPLPPRVHRKRRIALPLPRASRRRAFLASVAFLCAGLLALGAALDAPLRAALASGGAYLGSAARLRGNAAASREGPLPSTAGYALVLLGALAAPGAPGLRLSSLELSGPEFSVSGSCADAAALFASLSASASLSGLSLGSLRPSGPSEEFQISGRIDG